MLENWKEAVVSKIAIAVYVAPFAGKSAHRDRPFHGFVLNDEHSVKDYFFSDGRVLHADVGELFYLPKGTSYRVKTICPGGCWAINFDADVTDLPFSMSFRNRDAIVKIFKSAEKEWRQRSELRHAVAMKAVYDIILQMQIERQRQYLPDAQLSLLTPALQKIALDFTRKELSVAELATLCGISETYFRKLFLNKFGVTPKEYLISMRIDYARQLLETGQLSVSETALLCGYAEVCHFSREFTKRVGISPNAYKNAGR